MKVLAIETSTLVGSIAVVELAGGIANELASACDESGNHSQRIIEHIDSVMSGAGVLFGDLAAICIGIGPGSFTGLRIGLATAKGLALATNTPLWPASSLAALACTAPASPLVIAAADARRGEIFLGGFRPGQTAVESIAAEKVVKPSAFAQSVLEIAEVAGVDQPLIVGEATTLYPQEVRAAGQVAKDAPQTPQAKGVALVAAAGDRLDQRLLAAPAYVRPSEAEIRFPSGNPGGTFASFAKKP